MVLSLVLDHSMHFPFFPPIFGEPWIFFLFSFEGRAYLFCILKHREREGEGGRGGGRVCVLVAVLFSF